MSIELINLLVNWKVAGFVDCRLEWLAIEKHLGEEAGRLLAVEKQLAQAKQVIANLVLQKYETENPR